MNIECKITVQDGRDIFNELNTDIERSAVRMYLISDFMNQLEYKYGLTGQIDIETVFDTCHDYIDGVRIEP